jgi:hypothetical protein
MLSATRFIGSTDSVETRRRIQQRDFRLDQEMPRGGGEVNDSS